MKPQNAVIASVVPGDEGIERLRCRTDTSERFDLVVKDGEIRIVDPHDDGEPIPDGGAVAERDEPDLPQVIEAVLDDAASGVNRQVLIERVAELSGATLDEVEEALGGEIRHGRAIVVDGEVRKTPNRRFAGGGRR